MTINVTVGNNQHSLEKNPIKVKLNIRKTIDGSILIMDHNDVDIVIVPSQKKIIIFPKSSLHDDIYACQDRVFNFLASKGVIKRESVQAGDVYGSLQAEYPEAVNNADATQLVLFTISKFLEEEKPHMEMEQYFEDEFEKRLLRPDESDSTELGEIPHSEKKGTITPNKLRSYIVGLGPYG